MTRRVVITGAGVITPLGRTVDETFTHAALGQSGISAITTFDTTDLPCRIGGQIPDTWIDGETCQSGRLASRGLRLMLHAASEAVATARLDEIADRERIAVVLGCHGDNPGVAEVVRLLGHVDASGHWDVAGLAAAPGIDVLQAFRRKPDVAAALLAAHHDCRGPCLPLVSACAAGAQAIGEASRLIRDCCADAALAGGAEATLSWIGFMGFVLLKAMAERYASPESASRPFDRRRCGLVMSEGAGVLVLEAEEQAIARGVPILGHVLGYGDSADAYRFTDARPDGAGAALAMRAALAEAGLEPAAVDAVNAHGTSTLLGDLAETRAIKAALGERAATVPVSANKSMLGHTMAASGAIAAVLALEGMRRSTLLPTINLDNPDPRCDLDYVPNEARAFEHRVTLVNSFGFGGQNACLCLGAGRETAATGPEGRHPEERRDEVSQ